MAILITTSRRTARLINTFVKELAARIPGSIKIQRGKSSWHDLVVRMGSLGCDRLIVVSRWKGGPRFVDMFVLEGGSLRRYATLYVKSYKLRQPRADEYKAESLVVELSPGCEFDASVALKEFLDWYLKEDLTKEPTTKLIVGYDGRFITLFFSDAKTERVLSPMLRLDGLELHVRGLRWRGTK